MELTLNFSDNSSDLEKALTGADGKPIIRVHRIGGAQLANELDAKRAIREGTLLAGNL